MDPAARVLSEDEAEFEMVTGASPSARGTSTGPSRMTG